MHEERALFKTGTRYYMRATWKVSNCVYEKWRHLWQDNLVEEKVKKGKEVRLSYQKCI